jgi:membrane fusion protein (multidrug efflux system)
VERKAIVGGVKNSSVFVVKYRRATKVDVKTGITDTDFVEITEGLTHGETVVLSGQINLKDGDGGKYSQQIKYVNFIITKN